MFHHQLSALALGGVGSLCGVAWGQSDWTVAVDADATLVLAPGWAENVSVEPVPILGETSFGYRAERVLDNGLEVGVRTVWRVQRDHPERPGFTGRLRSCPVDDIICEANRPDLRGGFSRLTLGGEAEDTGALGSIEAGYLYADGGWGEVVLGLDKGIAARFFEGGPTAFALSRSHDTLLDPSGLASVRTQNDVTGPNFKVSYASPRILGARLGLSFTPDVSRRGLDLDAARRVPGVQEPDFGPVVEAGLNVSRLFRDQDLRVRASATASLAETETPAYRDMATYSLGGEIERRGRFSAGASYLWSDNAVESGQYRAWHAGATLRMKDWDFTVDGGAAQDDLLGLDGSAIAVSLGRDLTDEVSFAIGYGGFDAKIAEDPAVFRPKLMQESNGLILEFQIRWNNR